MKHLFASGEHIYKKNVKQLRDVSFEAEYLVYDEVAEDTEFEAVGRIEDKNVSVKFRIKGDSYSDIKFRHTVKILMQSDILLADWENYEIVYL
ncbi:MAG: hypothetical protein N3I35_07590 [Clostridia bacterium]|nr:hypothetical protein [Clostridia bacterium]